MIFNLFCFIIIKAHLYYFEGKKRKIINLNVITIFWLLFPIYLATDEDKDNILWKEKSRIYEKTDGRFAQNVAWGIFTGDLHRRLLILIGDYDRRKRTTTELISCLSIKAKMCFRAFVRSTIGVLLE